MEASARADWYIKKLASATGPAMMRIQRLNFPSLPGLQVSTIRPMVTSVKASTNLATKNRVPTAPALMPRTFI